jgi:hypothetical protein
MSVEQSTPDRSTVPGAPPVKPPTAILPVADLAGPAPDHTLMAASTDPNLTVSFGPKPDDFEAFGPGAGGVEAFAPHSESDVAYPPVPDYGTPPSPDGRASWGQVSPGVPSPSAVPLNMMAANVVTEEPVAGYRWPPESTARHAARPTESPPAFAAALTSPRRRLVNRRFLPVGIGLLLVAAASSPASSPTGAVATEAKEYTLVVERPDRGCTAHSHGKVAKFFGETDCVALTRAVYTRRAADGGQIVVSVATVTMSDDRAAAALRSLADSNGTGNVNDLLREGTKVPGGPDQLSNAGYASHQDGRVVTIVQTDFADRARSDDALLTKLAADALRAQL